MRARQWIAIGLWICLLTGGWAVAQTGISTPTTLHAQLTRDGADDGDLLLAWLTLPHVSATELAISGELDSFDREAACEALFARLMQRGEQVPVLLWLPVTGNGCQDAAMRAEATVLLRNTQPDNLAVHLQALHALPAGATPDPALRSALRSASTYDAHVTGFIHLLSAALLRHSPDFQTTPADEDAHRAQAVMQAMGYHAALVQTAEAALSRHCRPGTGTTSLPRKDCRQMAGLLAQHGETAAERLAGHQLLQQLADDPIEKARHEQDGQALMAAVHRQVAAEGSEQETALLLRLADGRQTPYEALVAVFGAADCDGCAAQRPPGIDSPLERADRLEAMAHRLAASGQAWGLWAAAQHLYLAHGARVSASHAPGVWSMPAQGVEWIRTASAQTQDPALLLALLLQPAPELDAQRSQWLARLRVADPDNLLWVGFDAASGKALGADALAQRLEQPVAAVRFHLYYTEMQHALARLARQVYPEAFARLQALDDDDALPPLDNTDMGDALALAGLMPAIAVHAWQACDPQRADWNEARRPACLHALHIMRDRSDTLVGEAVALATLRKLAADTPEEAEAVRRQRDARWRLAACLALRERDSRVAQIRALIDPDLSGTELTRIDDCLRAAGQPLTAPQGWRSPHEGG